MNPLCSTLSTAAAVAVFAFAWPALAGSLGTSSAAGGSSASVAASSASESSETSSDSSKKAVAELEGAYRVADLAPVPERPELLRLTLRPVGAPEDTADVRLLVPRRAVEQGRVAPGGEVVASRRDYGVELARADTREAFLLVLDDAWQRELRPVPVTL